MSKKITHLIIHCSDSTWGCASIIDNWHRGKGWRKIGYHFVICNGRLTSTYYQPLMDGAIEAGRTFNDDAFLQGEEVGAHALGLNSHSLGICLIGKGKDAGGKVDFTDRQMDSVFRLSRSLMRDFSIPLENVLGHYETPQSGGKTCPNMDMKEFRWVLKTTTP